MFSLQQLQYILALEAEGSFVAAAELCGVTQPTLSMQIQKLEQELGMVLFDRGHQPILPTKEGKMLLERAKAVQDQVQGFMDQITELQGNISGKFRLGVIPTIAPYLVPKLVQPFLDKFPEVELIISEHYTADTLPLLELGKLDAALIATHEGQNWMDEQLVMNDAFVAYVSPNSDLYRKTTLTVTDLEQERLWLLQEGHCMRTQVVSLCQLKSEKRGYKLQYEAGNIDTLMHMVERYGGATLIPSISLPLLNAAQNKRIRYFRDPEPVRPIILASRKSSGRTKLKQGLLDILQA